MASFDRFEDGIRVGEGFITFADWRVADNPVAATVFLHWHVAVWASLHPLESQKLLELLLRERGESFEAFTSSMVATEAVRASPDAALSASKVFDKRLLVPICATWTHNEALMVTVVHNSLSGVLRCLCQQDKPLNFIPILLGHQVIHLSHSDQFGAIVPWATDSDHTRVHLRLQHRLKVL